MDLTNWIEYSVLGNSLALWAVAAAAATVVFTVLLIVRRIIRKRLEKLAQSREVAALKIAADVVSKTKVWLLLLVALFAATRFLDFPDNAALIVSRVVVIGLLVQLGIWAVAGFGKILDLRREEQLKEDPGAVAAMDVVGFVIRMAIWTIVLLLTLDNLGVNITALVAGLGVGGIAVALAAQNIVSDLFASLSIVLDKPFVIGDFLVIGDLAGSVERVGVKTTRVRSLSGEQLVFSNNDLLSSRIRNFGRMAERRVVFKLGVVYQTPLEKLREIPAMIRKIIDDQDNARFDRAHFQAYGDFALTFEIVFYVQSADYAMYMDIQQAINLSIFEQFAAAGIEFAYPTRTHYVIRTSEDAD